MARRKRSERLAAGVAGMGGQWADYPQQCFPTGVLDVQELGASVIRGALAAMTGRSVPQVKRILVSGPCTIVFWADSTKTIVRCPEGKDFSEYEAFTAALAEKVYGSNSQVKKEIARKLERQVEKDA